MGGHSAMGLNGIDVFYGDWLRVTRGRRVWDCTFCEVTDDGDITVMNQDGEYLTVWEWELEFVCRRDAQQLFLGMFL